MTEADIIALTYEDTCTVYRPYKDTLPSGESIFRRGTQGKIVYESIPCALSMHTGGKLTRTQSTSQAPSDYSLFVRPEIDIQPGDTVLVLRCGKQLEVTAGQADRHLSHNNVPVSLSEARA